MHHYFRDYLWKDGKPYGVHKTPFSSEAILYRLVSDPYQKWITIEIYNKGSFQNILYDSRFLDFRKLTPTNQNAWRRQSVDETEAWIFNEDDRLILKEVCLYKEEICREVKIYSPYHLLICCYEMEEGPAGPVSLWDSNGHRVMSRTFDSSKNKFKEVW